MLIVRLQHSKTLGARSDLVSYRGPRSMVTVNMSVDSRLTDHRYLGQASVDTRLIIGNDSVNVVPL